MPPFKTEWSENTASSLCRADGKLEVQSAPPCLCVRTVLPACGSAVVCKAQDHISHPPHSPKTKPTSHNQAYVDRHDCTELVFLLLLIFLLPCFEITRQAQSRQDQVTWVLGWFLSSILTPYHPLSITFPRGVSIYLSALASMFSIASSYTFFSSLLCADTCNNYQPKINPVHQMHTVWLLLKAFRFSGPILTGMTLY